MIDALSGVTGTSVPTPADTSRTQISSDFNTFLRMLSVQMKNQDPLNPIDSSDYAVQLATFSSVEQQVRTNTLLEGLGAQFASSGLADLAAWVGRDARVSAPVQFQGTPVTLYPNPLAAATKVELVVHDSRGTEVQRLELPVSAEPVDWAGVGDGGVPFGNGLYSFEVVSYSGDDVLASETPQHYARVREVRSELGETYLIFDGDVAVAAGDVAALRDVR